VRVSGGTNDFTTLSPRQPVPVVPYAQVAATAVQVPVTNLTGRIADAQLSPNVALLDSSPTFAGTVTAQTFTGDGAGLTGLSLSAIGPAGTFTLLPGGFFLASSPAVESYPSYPQSVVAADVDGDGWADLISANFWGGTLSVLTNNGSGGFALSVSLAAGAGSDAVAAADVNGDGRVDLISANGLASTLSVLTNDGTGGFAVAASPTVGSGPASVAAADVNGDGLVDLISANHGTWEGLGNTLTVLTNDGNGGFALAASPTTDSGPFSVAAADVNGDGRVDLISANEATNTLSVLTNDGSGSFALAASLAVGRSPWSVVPADVNGDGWVDLVSANNGANTLSVLTNDGRAGFALAASPAAVGFPASVTAADVNGDGRMDLISADGVPRTLSVLTNDGSGGFALAASPALENWPRWVVAADVNGDGRVDLITANPSANTLAVLWNLPERVSGTYAGTFTGDGSGLTNVALLNRNQTFTGTAMFSPASGPPFAVSSSDLVPQLNADRLDGLHASDLWQIHGNSNTVAGTHFVGTVDNQPLELKVNDERALRLEPATNGPNVIGGFAANAVASGVFAATISGGGGTIFDGTASPNQIAAHAGTISGGAGNTIAVNANGATIGGGWWNTISSPGATIGGGYGNVIHPEADASFIGSGMSNSIAFDQDYSVICGGQNNTILGGVEGRENNCTIAGGRFNVAAGWCSFAAGNRAQALHNNTFVWADSTDADFASTADNQVSFRCAGGARFASGEAGANQTVAWTPGSGSWSFSSDRSLKERFKPVDSREVLEKVSRLPIGEWNYIGYPQRHIGPMAQDFHAQFPLNDSDTTLNSADLHGVALAAVQGLNQKLEEKNAALQLEVAELKALVRMLAERLNGGAQ
jgi:hypothetical protein